MATIKALVTDLRVWAVALMVSGVTAVTAGVAEIWGHGPALLTLGGFLIVLSVILGWE